MSLPGKPFVFLDSSGRRWPLLRKLGITVLVLAGAALLVFLYSLFIAPPLPSAVMRLKKEIRALQKQYPEGQLPMTPLWVQYAKARQEKAAGGKKPEVPGKQSRPISRPGEIRMGRYVSWDARSWQSLSAHARRLTHVTTESLQICDVGGTLAVNRDKRVEKFLRENHLVHIPLLTNLGEAGWVPEGVEYLAFGPPAHREKFVAKLAAALAEMKAGGVLIDWQEVDPTYQSELTALFRQIAEALHKDGRELWLAVPVGDDLKAFDLPELAGSVDRFVAVLHDENGEDDEPGPIASQDWFEGWLNALLAGMDPAQWIVELGAYGYDWNPSGKTAEEINFSDAMTRARYSGAEDVVVKAPALNPSFSYTEEGREHAVWFLDAITFFNQLRAASASGVAGIAVERLGTEDPDIWRVLEMPRTTRIGRFDLSALSKIQSDTVITHVGEGEIVTVETLAQKDGLRALRQEAKGNLTATYKDFPVFPTLIHNGGNEPGRVAITFDDGPDPEWTPKILDILRQYHAKAAFFVIGSNAEQHPDLLRRILREGHELGNHTYSHSNLAVVPRQQIGLELNATQRLIETATGRSTQMFRPPYDADSRPESVTQLLPLTIAQDLGYFTVLEQIDPEDWERPGAEEIVRRVKAQRGEGTVLLLHDAGGDRSQTVQALPSILDYLKQRGDRICSLAELLGTTDDDIMPHLAKQKGQAFEFAVSGIGFQILRVLQSLVWFFIISATVLVALRTVVILVLALCHWRKKLSDGTLTPSLSIIVPAFKEGKVIAATLLSLLDTDYAAPMEILVVDDGSPDNTASEVRRIAAQDARVRLIEQPNRGKAAALENGIRHAAHDTLVFLDADTRFTRGTLRRLVQPLQDGRVGAVAGHPRVGNLRTLLTRCQDIEYIVAFNLERRALSQWNAVTVVPGAVSVFRRQAIVDAGGFRHDTLAEDTDLTLAIHEAGWRIECAPQALALTEAPETIRGLIKQRFRWALGTMQCVWKHRAQTFSRENPALGWFSLPGIWFFQVVLVAFAPFMDLLFAQSALMGHWEAVLPYFSVFLLSDLVLALVACRMEPEKWTKALWILPMRFIYRPVLSYVIWKAIIAALRGVWVGWGKLDRTGSVTPAHAS